MRNVPNFNSSEYKINQRCKKQEMKHVSLEAVADSHCYCVLVGSASFCVNSIFSRKEMSTTLKGQFTQKRKFSHYLLTLMSMEGQVQFFGSQNIIGVSQENGIVVISQTIVVNGDQHLNLKKNIIKLYNAFVLLVQSNLSVLKPRHAK